MVADQRRKTQLLFRTKPATAEEHDETDTPKSELPTYQGFDLAYVMGKFDPKTHPDFSSISLTYADRDGLYMRTDAYLDFQKMFEAAESAGIKLKIRSAARNFNYQKGIWERKWKGETKIENGKDASVAYPKPVDRARKILLYSSMPGTSRHHWGTDIDLNQFNNEWFQKGQGAILYSWLVENAGRFGFCQPYTKKDNLRPNGYEEERWHWTYMPIAQKLTALAKDSLDNDMISGFEGAEIAIEVDMLQNYVLGIHPSCK